MLDRSLCVIMLMHQMHGTAWVCCKVCDGWFVELGVRWLALEVRALQNLNKQTSLLRRQLGMC